MHVVSRKNLCDISNWGCNLYSLAYEDMMMYIRVVWRVFLFLI